MESYNENPKLAKAKEFFHKILEKLQLTHFLFVLLVGFIFAVTYLLAVMDRPVSPFTKNDQTSNASGKNVSVQTTGPPKGWHDPVSYISTDGRGWILPDGSRGWNLRSLFSDEDLKAAGYVQGATTDECAVTVGWACDPDNFLDYVGIKFYKYYKLSGIRGEYIGKTVANYTRKQVSGWPSIYSVCGNSYNRHGFIFKLPNTVRTGSSVSIMAYALNINSKGEHTLDDVVLGGGPITVKCMPNSKPVYYFKNKSTGAYYYTIQSSKAAKLKASSSWIYGRRAFYTYGTQVPGSRPVYYFKNKSTGAYYYTIQSPQVSRLKSSSSWIYGGRAFYTYGTQVPGSRPVYYFKNKSTGVYYYGVQSSKVSRLKSSSSWTYKGKAFYAK